MRALFVCLFCLISWTGFFACAEEGYFPENRRAPKLQLQTVLPLLTKPSPNSCRSALNQDPKLGLIYVDHGKSIASQGRHVGLEFYNDYMMGGFGGLGQMSYTHRDRYIGVYQWTRGATEFPTDEGRPEGYDQIVGDFLTQWRSLHPEWTEVDEIATLEATHDWRRSSFITMAFDGHYFAGARLFDGNEDPVIMDESGRLHTGLISGSGSVNLPLEVRFPEVSIEGRKIEIGLMTSDAGVEHSFATIFFKLARIIVDKYGAGQFEEVNTNIPMWVESEQLGTVNIGTNSVSQVYRAGPRVDYGERVSYQEFVPDREQTLLELNDMHVYLVVNSRMANFYERTVPEVENLRTLDGETPGSLALMRIQASAFVDRFFFSVGQVEPEINSRASEIPAYRRADMEIRRGLLEESRRRRRWLEIANEAVEGTYPGHSLADVEVTIRGDFMDPDAALHIHVFPRKYTPLWRSMFAIDAHEMLEDAFREFDEI